MDVRLGMASVFVQLAQIRGALRPDLELVVLLDPSDREWRRVAGLAHRAQARVHCVTCSLLLFCCSVALRPLDSAVLLLMGVTV